MAVFDRGQVVTVPCRECSCPGTPGAHHLMDEVSLRLEPSLRMAAAIELRIAAAVKVNGQTVTSFDDEAFTLDAMDIFIRYGVVAWNLVDEAGQPRAFDVEDVLGDMSLGMPAADKASELYIKKVTNPLVQRLATISNSGQPVASTSRPKKSTSKRHGRSSHSTSAGSLRSIS